MNRSRRPKRKARPESTLHDHDLWDAIEGANPREGAVEMLSIGTENYLEEEEEEEEEDAVVNHAELRIKNLQIIKRNFLDKGIGSLKDWKESNLVAKSIAHEKTLGHTDPIANNLINVFSSSVKKIDSGIKAVIEIPKLRSKRTKIPRSDGRIRELNVILKRFTPEWLDSWFDRIRILNQDPIYQFIIALSGAINTDIQLLYDLEDFESKIRRNRQIVERMTSQAQSRTQELSDLQTILRGKYEVFEQLSQLAISIRNQQPLLIELEKIESDMKNIFLEYESLEVEDRCQIDNLIFVSPLKDPDFRESIENPTSIVSSKELLGYEYIKLIYVELTAENNIYRDFVMGQDERGVRNFGKVLNDTVRRWIKSCGRKIQDRLNAGELFTVNEKIKLLGELERAIDMYLLKEEAKTKWIIIFNNVMDTENVSNMREEYKEWIADFSQVITVFIAIEFLANPPKDARFNDVIKTISQTIIDDFPSSLSDEVDFVDINNVLGYIVSGNLLEAYDDLLKVKIEEIRIKISSLEKKGFKRALEELQTLEEFVNTNIQNEIDAKDIIEAIKNVQSLAGFQTFLAEQKAAIGDDLSNIPEIDQITDQNEEEIDELIDSIKQLEENIQDDFYSHSSEWAMRPENSGIIQLDSMVVYAIDQAFNFLVSFRPDIAKAGIEKLQTDPVAKPIFVSLVASEIASSRVNSPAGMYMSKTTIDQINLKKLDTIQRMVYLEYNERTQTFEMDLSGGNTLTSNQVLSLIG